MQDYQQRILTEKSELDEKRLKLKIFIESIKFPGLPRDERQRLLRQADAMSNYSTVLAERIENFK